MQNIVSINSINCERITNYVCHMCKKELRGSLGQGDPGSVTELKILGFCWNTESDELYVDMADLVEYVHWEVSVEVFSMVVRPSGIPGSVHCETKDTVPISVLYQGGLG